MKKVLVFLVLSLFQLVGNISFAYCVSLGFSHFSVYDSNGESISTVNTYSGEYTTLTAKLDLNVFLSLGCDINEIDSLNIYLSKNTSRGQISITDQNGDSLVKNIKLKDLSTNSKGYYILPSFTFNDAGSVSVVIEVPSLRKFLSGETFKNSVNINYSPFALSMELEKPECSQDSECDKVSNLGNNETWLAGEEFNIKYTARAYCDALKNDSEPYSMKNLKSCPILPSFGYNTSSVSTITTRAKSLYFPDDDTSNYLVPKQFKFNQNSKDDRTGTTSTDGSTVRASYISDVGRFQLFIDSFKDALTGLTIKSSQYEMDEDELVAPYYFEVAPLSSSAVAEVSNTCTATDTDHNSFTYFGQPITPKISIRAMNKQGAVTTLFDKQYYEAITNYHLSFKAFTGGSTSGYSYLTNKDGSSRLVDCSWCTTGTDSDIWSSGVLNLNASTSENPEITSSSSYFLRILAKNYTTDSVQSSLDQDMSLEGESTLLDYRDEAPSYDGNWSRFYAYLGMNLQETSADGSSSVIRDIRPISSATRMSEISYINDKSENEKLVLFSGSPLELRMGRLALYNGRAGRASNLYMPIRAEYFRKIKNGDAEVSSGWILNDDDNCSLLSLDNFYIEPFGKTDSRVFLRTSQNVQFADGVVSKAQLVNEKSSSASTSSLVSAQKGQWYLRLSKPTGDASQVFFILRDSSVGLNYDLSSLSYISNFLPVRNTGISSGDDARYIQPSWLGTSLEGVDQSFGAFRSWPGSNRILYRLETLP